MTDNSKTTENKDRLSQYLTLRLKDYMFDELSSSYLDRAGIKEIMTGVPVPFSGKDLSSPETSTLALSGNMAFVIGCDADFKYKENYIAYILKNFGKDFAKPLVNRGMKAADGDDFEEAVIYFRAARMIDPDLPEALFGYARACHDAYESAVGADVVEEKDQEYVGILKAESLKAFERLTIEHEDFAPGFYYLGYAYLNLGLYIKARLTFLDFIHKTDDAELRAEVTKLEERLIEPCKIEEGINAILSGHLESGIDVLEHYSEDKRFNTWWPLWYYLGSAKFAMGKSDEAEKCFLTLLQYSPSNTDAMEALVNIYELRGDDFRAKKYRDKVALVNENAEMDRELKRSGMS